MDKSRKEWKHEECWETILFPYLLGLGLEGVLRCLMQVPTLDAKARKAG